MSSPLPPDPYEALGVAQDADTATIRIAHRKLALKHHPDRIRDEGEREKGKNEFQKVQQAYEILSDPTRRSRYDDRVKLAEMRKQRMMRQASSQPAPTASPTTNARSSNNHARSDKVAEEAYYEFVERVPPPASYFERDHYDDPIPRATARKADSYDKKSTPPRPSEKREKVSAKWTGPIDGMTYKVASQMKAKAAEAKIRTKDRDKEKRRERSDKQTSRRAPYVEVESNSDSDTVVPRSIPKPKAEYRHRSAEVEPELIRGRVPPPRRSAYDDDDDHDGNYEKWERLHKNSRDYITESQRKPGLSRSGSDAYVYWEGDSRSGRRSGSDGERRSTTTKSRRSTADDARPRPSMPAHTSAPSNLRPYEEPPRAKTHAYPERESHREPPSLPRSQTMPVRPKRADNLPARGSNLKHSETQQQDSGYYSSSNPHTPEMRGDSPPRDAPREPPRRAPNSVKYMIVEPTTDSDEDAGARRPRLNRVRVSTRDDERRLYQSPERMSNRDRDRDSDRERPRDRPARPRLHKLETEGRPRSARTPPSSARADFGRYEPQSPHETSRSKLFGEMNESAPPSSYNYPQPPNVRTASYRSPTYAEYRNQSPEEYGPDSRFRQGSNYPATSRRPSVY